MYRFIKGNDIVTIESVGDWEWKVTAADGSSILTDDLDDIEYEWLTVWGKWVNTEYFMQWQELTENFTTKQKRYAETLLGRLAWSYGDKSYRQFDDWWVAAMEGMALLND